MLEERPVLGVGEHQQPAADRPVGGVGEHQHQRVVGMGAWHSWREADHPPHRVAGVEASCHHRVAGVAGVGASCRVAEVEASCRVAGVGASCHLQLADLSRRRSAWLGTNC